MKEEWKKIYSKNGKLMYEGFTKGGKPFGAGTSYYSNGKKCQEGVFDSKGLVYGREYYKNGRLRFEGAYRQNKGYGPNYPAFGSCCDEDGNEYFYGELTVALVGSRFSPVIEKPECYGAIKSIDHPDFDELIWHRKVKKLRGEYHVKISGKSARKEFVDLLEKNGFKNKDSEPDGIKKTIDSKFPIVINVSRKEYETIGNTTCAAAAASSKVLITAKDFLLLYEIMNSLVIV